jgi:outer membrane receptor protein involved in Fe transport
VVRGISALRQEAPQPVSVFVDGVYMRDGVLGLILDDAQRIEVIKGPQSALYGRSTYAGAINYITPRPGPDLAGRVTLTAAQHGEVTAFGVINIPIQKDMLSARIKAKHYSYDGQYTNSQTGNKLGNERTNAGGVALYFTPTPKFDAVFSLDTSRERDGIFPATVRPVPTQAGGVVTSQNGSTNAANGGTCDGRTINIVGNNAAGLPDPAVPATAAARLNGWPCGAATFTGTTLLRNERDLANYTDPVSGQAYGNIAGLDREINRGSLTLNYNFSGGYTLTSQTASTRQQSNVGADQSYSAVQFAPGNASWLSYNRDKLTYSSQEFRLNSPTEDRFSWLVGAFFYQEETSGFTANGVIARNTAGATVPAPRGLTPVSASELRNFAPFGRVQYEITPKLRVSAEGRYNSEQVKVGGTPLGTATVTVGTCVAGQVCFINGDRTFKDFSPRFTLDYKPSKNMLVYAQAATGSKSGGFNTTPGLPDSVFTFEGEKINSVEVGFKAALADGRVGFNMALFRNDIDGLQLSNLSTVVNPFNGTPSTTTIVNNVGKARTQGLELDLSVRATDWLTLSGNYAYTDAKALEGTEITNGTVFGGNRSVAGFTLPRSPKHSSSGSAAVDLPLAGTGLRAFGRVDVVYQSRRYAEIQNMIWADPFTRVNASAGVRGKGWRASLWVKNATDDNTSINGFRYLDPTTFRRTAVDFLPRLRQFGVTGTYEF